MPEKYELFSTKSVCSETVTDSMYFGILSKIILSVLQIHARRFEIVFDNIFM